MNTIFKMAAIVCLVSASFSAPAFAGNCSKTDYKTAEASNMSTHKMTKLQPESVTPDIVGLASGSDDFSTLVAAVKAADLVGTLQSDGPFTVFAPTNAAFGSLPDGTVATLLEPDNKPALQEILTYHVVAGEVKATDLVSAIQSNGGVFEITTVNGKTLNAQLINGTPYLIDGQRGVAKITKTDLKAANGVIHVLDKVVLP